MFSPLGHVAQALEDVCWVWGWAFPEGQDVHAGSAWALQCPVPQSEQLPAPELVWACPAGQSEHDASPLALYFPGTHGSQAEAREFPVLVRYFPVGQLEQPV